MTTELDRASLTRVIELLQPLLGLSDAENFIGLFDAVGWDANALGITDPTVFASIVQSLADALQGLEGLVEKENIELMELAEALVPLVVAIAQIIDLASSLSLPSGAPTDTLSRFSEDLLNFLVEHYMAMYSPWPALVLEYSGIFKAVDLPEIKSTDGVILGNQLDTGILT